MVRKIFQQISKRRMRILFITDYYPPMSGGVARSITRITQTLSSLNVEVFVLCFDNQMPIESEDYFFEEQEGLVTIFRVGPFFLRNKYIQSDISAKQKTMMLFRVTKIALQICKNIQPDLIVSFFVRNSGIVADFISNRLELPLVLCFRGAELIDALFGNENFSRLQALIEKASGIVCVSTYNQNLISLFSDNAISKCITINNSIEIPVSIPDKLDAKKRICEITGWHVEDPIVGFIGDLRERKGINQLLNSLISLQDISNLRFLVVGPHIQDAQVLLTYKNQIDQLTQSNRMHISGHISHSLAIKTIAAADILAMPSLDDGMPNGLLEGMICGLCPVVTEVHTDIVKNNVNGLVISADNTLEDILRYLINNRSRIVEFGSKAAESVRMWTPLEEAGDYIRYFQAILDNSIKK